MIIDFEHDTEKSIDNCVKTIRKLSNTSYTRGALRTFIVDTVLSSLSEDEIMQIIVNRVRTGV